MKRFNVEEVFSRYKDNPNLTEADIFHLYDTGEECIKDNSGFHDSRHFELVIFNTETMEKKHCGRHDGITNVSDSLSFRIIRIFADGSFFIRLNGLSKVSLLQDIMLS